MRIHVAGRRILYSFFFGALFVAPKCFAIFQSTPLKPFYCQSVHLPGGEAAAIQYENWSKLREYPGNLAENSSAQLFDSVAAFIRQSHLRIVDQPMLSDWQGKTLFLNEKIPQQWVGLWVLHATVEKALREQGIDSDDAFTVGILAQRALAEAQNENWTAYRKKINHVFKEEVIPKRLKLNRTFQDLLKAVHVDKTFQIPYLAGYAKQDAHQIYIDRGVKSSYRMQDGRKIDVSLDLTIHEFVEKCLIDWTQLSEKKYLRTHQIAQRIEKAMVEFYGYSWSDYQGRIMKYEIERADHDGRSAETLVRVPADLDLTPYIEYQETEMMDLMKKAAIPGK